MNSTTIHRRIAAGAVAAIACSAFAACGAEIAPPAQDITKQVEKRDTTAPDARYKTGNRSDFGDEYGKAEIHERKASPAGSGTRNRMDFGDEGY